MKREGPVKVILRSCLTGVPVWVYVGPSMAAMRKAYRKVCREEVERVRNWDKTEKEISEALGRRIDEFLSRFPKDHKFTPQQEEALKTLRAQQNEKEPCYMEFYNHIMEEARRRNEASKRWVEQRKKTFGI